MTAPRSPVPDSSTPRLSSPPPTTRALAAKLGICHNTVARALRNAPRVSPATRQRVLEAAAAAGYRVNPLVTALMAQVRQHRRVLPSGEVLAFLTAAPTEHAWKRLSSHVDQFAGARAKAAAAGFDLQAMWLGSRGEHSRQLSRVMAARGVRGAMIAPPPPDLQPSGLDWSRMAVVTLGSASRCTRVPLHHAGHYGNDIMPTCFIRLHEAGYRRIGIAINKRFAAQPPSLIASFIGTRWWFGGKNIPPLLIDDDDGSKVPFFRWLEKHRPDAVIGIWPDCPLSWLNEYGIRVPEDAAYVSIDVGGDNIGKIAGIRQDNRGLGMAAADLLIGQIFRNEIGSPVAPIVTLVKSTWQDGPTMRQVNLTGAAMPPCPAARPRGVRQR
ncbi:MAG: LacI family DNA-binding transcriptional regulator [Opitutaceae bacterium]|jgi:DNA-binding LacI/PurR family transcriptional regulator|nr:LacI family DNA-binding transcriptional regulator [Opitutaceae bacterium]